MSESSDIKKPTAKLLVIGGRGTGNTLHAALELIEENTKLKAEIEDLKNQISCKDMIIEDLEIEKSNYFADLCKAREWHKTEIIQLKEEIKQLKIQIDILEEGKDCYTCKHLELEEKQEPCRSCIEQSNWEVEE